MKVINKNPTSIKDGLEHDFILCATISLNSNEILG